MSDDAHHSKDHLYRLAFDAMDDPVIIFDAESRQILSVNEAAIKMYGYPRRKFLSLTYDHLVAPPDMNSDSSMFHVDGAGNRLRVEAPTSIFCYEGRNTFCAVIRNLSDCGELERSLLEWQEQVRRDDESIRIQRDLALAIGDSANLQDTLRICTESAIQASQMDCGGVYLLDEKTGGIHLAYHTGLSDGFVQGALYSPSDSKNVQFILKGSPVYTQYDVIRQPGVSTYDDEGLKAIAVIPISHDGRVIACLNIASHTVEEISDRSRYILETMAGQIGQAIAREQISALKQQTESNLLAFFESVDDMLFILDEQGNILKANPTALRVTQYAEEELTGQSVLKVHPEDRREEAFQIVLAMLEGTCDVCEVPIRTRNGNLIPVETRIARGHWNGKPAIYGVTRDVTKPKEAEKSLQYHNAFYAVANEVSSSLVDVDNLDQKINEALELVGRFANVDRSYVFLVRSDGITVDNTHEWCAEGVSAQIHNLQGLHGMEDLPWAWKQLMGNNTVYLPTLDDCPPEADTEKAILEMQDIVSLLLLPMFCDNAFIGFLGFDSVKEHKKWEEDAQNLLRLTGQAIARAVVGWRAKEMLLSSEQRFRKLVESSPVAMLLADSQRNTLGVNYTFTQLFGYDASDIPDIETWWLKAYPNPDYRKTVSELWEEVLAETSQSQRLGSRPVEVSITCKDGTAKEVAVRVSLAGESHIVVFTDLTERKREERQRIEMERKIQHTQKLESLGVLAGGIAHDFNNILMAILGYTDLAIEDLPRSSPACDSLFEIEQAARRAADLCKQMLAYSGKGKFVVERIDLRELVGEMVGLLQTVISKKAALHLDFADNLPPIAGDPSQIRQIVMNTIINASEALADKSGAITVTIDARHCSRDLISTMSYGDDIPEGEYVVFEVKDNGCGMDSTTLARLFEPFFTTKFTGRGLGMSAVLGIVRGHEGGIKVESEAGKGTVFTVFLPATQRTATEKSGDIGAEIADWTASGRVLLVDDEDQVLRLAKRMLERFGFEVLSATDGEQAVEAFKANADSIAIVLMDLVMPKMYGDEAAGEIRKIRRDVPIILSSGYSEQSAEVLSSKADYAGFIQKPYKVAILRDCLRSVLGGSASARES